MRCLGAWGVALLAGALVACNGDKGKDDTGGETDADTDADTDGGTDTDTDGADTDTDNPEPPPPYECLDAACDADPAGTWNLLGECVTDPGLDDVQARCPEADIQMHGLGSDGTLAFTGSTYLFNAYGGSMGITFAIPPSCNTTGCLTWQVDSLAIECTTDGEGGCECQGSKQDAPWLDSGTWTRSGGELSLRSDATGGNKTFESCVSGNSLWLYDPVRDIAVHGVRPE